MQKGGKYDPDKPQGYNNYNNTAASSRLPEGRPSASYETRLQGPRTSLYPTPPMPTKDKATVTRAPPPRVDEDGLILAPSRWFGRDSAALSVVSIPRFRDIKSWARDQRTRVETKSRWSESTVEPVPSLPSGRYSRIDD
ncbi:hypothetical protein B0O99DRAFT_199675 [Bisporella sp. PMI_857]|nr:hypothetical protein B0O99DRAFT_199675 [Bisporella sp. PMI_857]